MNVFSAFINRNAKTKLIIFCFVMFVLIYFFASLAVEAFLRGSLNLKDLTHVTGIINNERYIKHLNSSTKYRPAYYEDVLVLSIQGCSDEFGFIENGKSYKDISRVHFGDNQTVADIYYNKSGKRIEENVTLHIFNLKINDYRFIKIEDIKQSELTFSAAVSIIALLLGWLTYFGIRNIKRQENIKREALQNQILFKKW